MLDRRDFSDEQLDATRKALESRGFSDVGALDRIAELSKKRRELITKTDELRQERNEASAAMAQVADKKSTEFAEKRDALRSLGGRIKEIDVELSAAQEEVDALLLSLPNLPSDYAPKGKSEADNVELRSWGEKPEFDFEAQDHVELGTKLGLIDFEGGVKISGARFTVLRGLGSRLNRALMQFMLDLHTDEHGYEELWVPVVLKDTSLFGTGQLPKFGKDAFRLATDDEWAENNDAGELYLCPTAEVPVTNLLRDEIVDADKLPLAYTAYSACFRSEAGSYGRDTRGLIRQHQFDKVELVRFVKPEDASTQHELLTRHAEEVLQRLGLHYRVIDLCRGDLGFAAKRCFDIEVWLPGQSAYREISSCSWFGDFQTRRIMARYRVAEKKTELLHSINGSGLALGRTLVAILEQGQRKDGSVVIPEALRPYMGGREVIAP